MMKAILTGMNGTVAPALAKRLAAEGVEVVPWDRAKVPTDDPARIESFIAENRPTWFFHIATGSPDWAATCARVCRARGITFLFTGSVSVFDGSKPGPFPADKVPDATDDYGRYKAECERRVRAENPDVFIARLGWQIGDAPGSNNLVDFLFRQVKEKGRVEVSSGIVHANCFLVDTVDALYRLVTRHEPGLYQIEGNPGLSLFEIATRIKKLHGFDFAIHAIDEPRRDIRMLNDRIEVGQLTARLGG